MQELHVVAVVGEPEVMSEAAWDERDIIVKEQRKKSRLMADKKS